MYLFSVPGADLGEICRPIEWDEINSTYYGTRYGFRTGEALTKCSEHCRATSDPPTTFCGITVR